MEDTSDVSTPDATISSANTSLSGLTGYEEEFNDLRLLAHSRSLNHNNDTSKLLYETTIKSLTTQLDNALKLNEKLKNDLFSKEKFYEEENSKRVNSLITKSAQLEAELTAVRCHIAGLFKQCCTKEYLVDESCLNVYEQIRQIQNELIRCNNDKNTSEVMVRNIKSELDLAKEEIQTRIVCVNELKRKVSEQYSGIESVSQYNRELESKFKSVENELDWYKKSESWYKEQLQNERKKGMVASQDFIKLQQGFLEKNKEIDKLNLTLNKCKYECEDLRVLQKREKDGFLKKIEALQLEIISRKSGSNQTNYEPLCQTCREKEVVIQSIKNEVNLIKSNAENQMKLYEELEKEKTNLSTRAMLLEKSLSEKELVIQHLEQQKLDLQNELSAKQMLEQKKAIELQNLRESNDALKVKMAALAKEKVEIENAVNVIRRDLCKFVMAHKQLKQNVSEKDSIISDLQAKIQALANDSSCSLMQSESKLEEISNQKSGCKLQIAQLNSNITLLEGTISELECKCAAIALEKSKLSETVQNILPEMEEKNRELTKLLQEGKLKRFESEKKCSELQIAVEEKEQVIQSLTAEVNNMKAEKSSLQVEILNLNKKLPVLKTQAEQNAIFNGFRISDEEKCYSGTNSEELILEILELISDRLLKIENNGLCKEDINIEMKLLNSDSKPFLLLQTIMRKLLSIDARVKKNPVNQSNQSILDVVSNFSDTVFNKMQYVLDKCNVVYKKTEGCYQTLKLHKHNIINKPQPATEEIIKLKAHQLDLKEKLKRYEINNHTLLRKVKEHMKARNTAEKQYQHIQSLYSSLNDSYKAAEEEVNNKKLELQQSDLLKANLEAHIADLQISLFNLETQMVEQKAQNNILNNSITEKETLIEKLNKLLEDKIVECDRNKDFLQKYENQMLHLKNLNAELSETARKSQEDLEALEQECSDLSQQLECNKNNLVEVENKLNISENRLQSFVSKPTCDLPHHKNLTNTVNKLELEVERLNNERWFLQRLCNDLKCALQASVNEKQVLKAHNAKNLCNMMDLTKKLPTPTGCNDALIKKLLKQSQESQVPLNVIREPLEMLKSELDNLQELVSK